MRSQLIPMLDAPLGGFSKLSASYLILPDELKNKKQKTKNEEKKANAFNNFIENTKNKITSLFSNKEQPSNNTFIINSPGGNNSGTLTGLGLAGTIGSSLAGVGGLATNRTANYLQNQLNSIDPYTDIARTKADNFVNALKNAKTPAERLLAYTEHGSDLMGSKLFKMPGNKQMSGRSFMQTLYSNPLLNKLISPLTDKPSEFKWDVPKAQHYGSFSKGPIRAYMQLLKEVDELKDPTELLNPLKSNTRTYMTAKLNAGLDKLNERLLLAESAGDNSKIKALERAIEKTKENLNNDFLDNYVNKNVGNYMKRYGSQTYKNLGGQYHGAALGYQLEQLAKNDPEIIAKYPDLLRGLKVTKLDQKDQIKLLKQFTNTDYGKRFADIFENQWKNPTSQYSTLAQMLTAPKNFIDANKARLSSFAQRGRNVALASLPLAALGLSLRSYGKQQDAARVEQSNDLLVKKIMAALSQNKTENSLSKFASAYLLPPSKPRKKKLQSEEEEKATLNKQAAVYAEEAFLLQQYEMQRHLSLNDFGNGWHP